MTLRTRLIPLLVGMLLTPLVNAFPASVLHWWTSPGESAAAEVMQKAVEGTGNRWVDMAVRGGGGGNAMTVLKSQVISGNAPTSAQINGMGIQSWATLDLLAPVQPVARREEWETKLPEFISETMQYEGRYYGVPINIHRNNWLWINPKPFKTIGAPVPDSWDELFELAPRLREAGYTPISLSGEAWQIANIFESVLLAEGGPKLYRDTLVKNKPEAMNSEAMLRTFKKLRQISQLTESHPIPVQSWNELTHQVIENQSAMLLSGDWALGEFALKDQVQGEDFICRPAFGTESSFIYNMDSMVMFNTHRAPHRRAQFSIASRLMSREFQEEFSRHKGSIPARLDAANNLQGCQKQSHEDLLDSIDNDSLVPSLSHGMATRNSVRVNILKVITRFMHDENMQPEQAVQSLASAVLAP